MTRADGAVVHEIDDAPAIDFYRSILALPSSRPRLPLAILNARDATGTWRATWGAVDAATGAVTFLADVPEGARVRLTLADRDEILTGCAESLSRARSNLAPAERKPPPPCSFRARHERRCSGTRTGEELTLIAEALGAAVAVCGFYGYGEISPLLGDPAGPSTTTRAS